jgi:hypothetical protein
MEKLLSQHFTYATITPFKNYSQLKDRRSLRTTFNDEDIDNLDSEGMTDNVTFSFDDIFWTKRTKKVGRVLGFSKPLSKRKTRFFYNNQEVDENIVINYGSLKSWELNSFETTKDRQIKRHFGDPFSEITVSTVERSINITDDKLTIKVYRQSKQRRLNGKYFKKGSSIQSFTFNLKTGNFVVAEISKTSKNIPTNRFRKNCFYTLYSMLNGRSGMFNIGKNHLNSKSKLLNEFKSIFDDKMYVDEVNKQFNFNLDYSLFTVDKFFSLVCQKFVETKKIKICDSYENLLVAYYPTEKYLKKNERKLVASILDLCKIKSKVTVKLVHQHPDIDLSVLVKLCLMLGKDYSKYVGNISGDVIAKVTYSVKSHEIAQKKAMLKRYIQDFNIRYVITNIEKENIVKVLCDSKINEDTINLIYDHFKMIEKIRPYDSKVLFSAKNYTDFHDEHMKFSKIISAIKKGWVIEYDFDKKLIDLIEEPIPVKGTDEDEHIWLYPHILKREEEYDEEGRFMHHCVGSYSDREMSVIISLRTEDGLDRVTSEFHAHTGMCIQSRHFCNANPPEYFNSAIEMLKDKVTYSAKKKMLKSINKRKVPVKINGVEITKEVENNSSRTLLQLLEAGEL